MVSLAELEKEIAEERQKLRKVQQRESLISQRKKLKSDLFKLKHRGLIEAGKRFGRGFKKGAKVVGKGLRTISKKATELQEREQRAIAKQSKDRKVKGFDPFGNLTF